MYTGFASLLPLVGMKSRADQREDCEKRSHTTKWSLPAQGAFQLLCYSSVHFAFDVGEVLVEELAVVDLQLAADVDAF